MVCIVDTFIQSDAIVMNRLGDKVLTRSGLPGDQHVAFETRELLHHFEKLLHRLRLAYQILESDAG